MHRAALEVRGRLPRGRGVIENKHSSDVASTPLPLRVCLHEHPIQCESSCDVGSSACSQGPCGAANNGGRSAVEEVYNEEDGGEGAEIFRLLNEAAAAGKQAWIAGGGGGVSSGGGGGGGAAALASSGAATGATFSSLEFAMADMAALLKGDNKVAKPDTAAAAAAAVGLAGLTLSPEDGAAAGAGAGAGSGAGAETSTSSTFGGGGDGGGGGGGEGSEAGQRTIVPRKYVSVTEDDDPVVPTPQARTVTVKLSADGAGASTPPLLALHYHSNPTFTLRIPQNVLTSSRAVPECAALLRGDVRRGLPAGTYRRPLVAST